MSFYCAVIRISQADVLTLPNPSLQVTIKSFTVDHASSASLKLAECFATYCAYAVLQAGHQTEQQQIC